jgi:hypothetical protein
MTNVHVITPLHGEVRPELALFRESLGANDRRYSLTLSYSDAQPTANNRNQIVRRFLKQGGDYLLMIDSDTIPLFNPLDYVARDLDVLGFPVPTWRGNHDNPLPWHPCLPDGRGLVKIDWVSTACILIARRVLEHPALRGPFLDEWDADGVRTAGEDQSFCRRALEAGFKIWCDTSRMCAHFKVADMATVWRYMQHELSKSGV